MELSYQKTFSVPLEGLTAEFIMHAMQETAEAHAMQLGFGRQALLAQENCVWMIARSSFELNIDTCRELTVETWPSGADAVQSYRGFFFYADGKLAGKASQSWLLVDIEKRRILPTNLFERLAQITNPDRPKAEKLRHIAIPEQRPVMSVTVRPEDIDLNGHMNNARYLFYAMLPTGRRTAGAIRIDFERELVEGDEIELLAARQENTWYVSGQMKNGLRAFCAVIR